MYKWLVTCGLIMAMGVAGPALAGDGKLDPVIVGKVDALLSGIEYVPTRQDWDRIGAEAAAVLRAIAADPKELLARRARAASSLAHFPGGETHSFLSRWVNDDAAPAMLRGKVARALALTAGDAAVPIIEPLLADQNKRLCEAVVKSLASIKTEKSRAALTRRLKVESRPFLKKTIETAIETADTRSK